VPPRNMLDLVPAAYVALLAALHVWLQRRYFDPLPWRAVVVFGAALALLLGAALAGGRTLLPLDGLRGQAPFRELPPTEPHGNPLHGDLLQLIAPLANAVREALAAGEWPLWNARAGAGMPLLANPQAQAFQPLALAAAPLGLFAAPAVAAALRVWVALAGMLLFLRRQGLGEGASTFGALAYGLGGFLLLWLGWPLANAAAWLPLLLYAIHLADERGARRDAALLLAAAFAVVTGGQPESVLYALAIAAAFLVARIAARQPERRLGLVARAGGALLLAGMLAAPLLLPTLEYLPHTLRATDRRAAAAAPEAEGDERRAPWHERAVKRLLPIAAPNAFGNGRFGDPSGAVYWGESNINEDASGFAGTLALLATGAGIGARRRLGQERLAWLLLAAALLVLALPPAALRGLARLPLWSLSATGHHRILIVVAFALAWLGACGVERAQRGELRWPLVLVAATVLAALLLWAYLGHAHPEHPGSLAVLRRGWLLLQLKVLAVGAAVLALAPTSRLAPGLLALVAAAELLTAHAPAHAAAPAPPALPEPPPIEFLRARLGEARMAALGGAFPANLPALYGLADARVYDPAEPALYARLTGPLLGRKGDPREFRLVDHPLYDALGVRYVLTAPGVALPLPLALRDPTAWVYERSQALPVVRLEGGDSGAALAHRRLGLGWVRAGVRVAGPSGLATSIYDDRQWRVLVDGERRAPPPRDAPFVAAALRRGDRVVDLLYRPASWVWGWLVAAVAAGATVAWLCPPPARARMTA
jgi:hypothetical protein